MFALAERLFPICRSLTGSGVRQTHSVLSEYLNGLKTHEIPTGTKCLDWVVPDEWNVRDAYILDASGERIVDFRENNLHLVGYSEPVDCELPLNELQRHLFSLPDNPTVIPYVTSYYRRTWGFCLTENQRSSLNDSKYRVVIDADLSPGSLTYSELYIPGASQLHMPSLHGQQRTLWPHCCDLPCKVVSNAEESILLSTGPCPGDDRTCRVPLKAFDQVERECNRGI